MLNIVLRTCLNSELENNIKNQFTRVCGDDRKQTIITCVKSLIVAIKNCNIKTYLTILDDNSTPEFIEILKSLTLDIDCNIISLDTPNDIKKFNYSAFEQFRIASEFGSLIYVVEDDYLHEHNALNEMIDAYAYLSKRFSKDKIKIFPFDCPLRYENNKEEPTFLFYSGTRYWRTVTYTSNTFFTHSAIVKEYFDV